MQIDLDQFKQTFLEEAGEHLDALESGLLALEKGEETDLNGIFRAAHSIKGGAGTFGFQQLAEFTHWVETVMDLAREDKLKMSSKLVTTLLQALDVMTSLVDLARAGDNSTPDGLDTSLAALKEYLGEDAAAAAQADDAEQEDNCVKWYDVNFKPKPDMPNTGSDPINIIREMDGLGTLEVKANIDNVPTLEDLDPEQLFISWDFSIETEAKDSDIRDVFMFVEDDAEIDIKEYAESDKKVSASEIGSALMDRRQEDRRQASRSENSAGAQTSFIRVAIDKVDDLVNLVGELVTTNSMVAAHSGGLNQDMHQMLFNAVSDMAQHTRNLQDAVMSIRMMPVSFAFNRFPRMVRDTAQKLGKQVELITNGEKTELDKTVIEQISDPLTHLVRNSVDHGIELPEVRMAAGKNPFGTVELNAFYKGGNVVIEIKDDGKGLDRNVLIAKAIEKGIEGVNEHMSDEQVFELIFHPGFSTAKEVTDLSGRGVGMDVVKRNIKALGGHVGIASTLGVGTKITISLPLTLAILDGMAVKVGGESYIVPLLSIVESFNPLPEHVKTMQGNGEVLQFRDEYLPLVRLHETLIVDSKEPPITKLEDGIAIVVESENEHIALFVDCLQGERQVVIKNIEENYKRVEGLSGATILGDGNVAFILDLPGVIGLSRKRQAKALPLAITMKKEGKQNDLR